MSRATTPSDLRAPSGWAPHAATNSAPVARPLGQIGHAWVWLLAFSGFFVLREPAPYELLGVAVIGVSFLFGMTLPRPVLPMLGLLILYVLGGFASVPIAPNLGDARFQILVTAFLAATSLFFACYTARDTLWRTALIRNAWQCGAILAALFGIMGYFGIAGTGELFTRFGRARGSFEDPNVFAPFLAGAVVFAIYTILSQPMKRWFFPIIVIAICSVGILLSFSRGAWGYTLYSIAVITVLHFILTPNPAERFRIAVLSLMGLGFLMVGVAVAFSIPAIGDLLTQRANLLQTYDGGELGRFGRHVLGFQLSIHHPLGLGALGFREMFGIDPHNVYLNALMTHGWLGFFAYITLVFMTAFQLLRVILFNPPLRAVAIPLFALFTGVMLMGTFIDTDRWRHFFLLLGLSWGVIAAGIANPYRRRSRHIEA